MATSERAPGSAVRVLARFGALSLVGGSVLALVNRTSATTWLLGVAGGACYALLTWAWLRRTAWTNRSPATERWPVGLVVAALFGAAVGLLGDWFSAWLAATFIVGGVFLLLVALTYAVRTRRPAPAES